MMSYQRLREELLKERRMRRICNEKRDEAEDRVEDLEEENQRLQGVLAAIRKALQDGEVGR